MNRVRICGEIFNRYEQTIELSDEELQEFRTNLNYIKENGDQAIDNFLGNMYGDIDPIDWECNEWSAELVDDKGFVIESLDT